MLLLLMSSIADLSSQLKKQKNYRPMKKIIIAFLLTTAGVFAQIPQGINYQAVARDANGNARASATVGVRFTLHQTTATGLTVWQEIHSSVTTNNFGQFNITFGQGVRVAGTAAAFSDISWSTATYFLETEIETTASVYVSIGSQQLMSVPFALAATDPTPAGVVQAYAGPTVPSGYIICDGSAVSRTTYAKLFAAIGTSWGAGDGTTTFNLPDMRGMFLRGVDGSAGSDPDKTTRTATNSGGNAGNAVGSKQTDAFQGHGHQFTNSAGTSVNSQTWYESDSGNLGMTIGGTTVSGTFQITNPKILTGYSAPSVANETRSKNVYVNYIIKF
jgi:microcystin-dependent protein